LSKKIKKLIKPRKLKKPNHEKKLIKTIKILKNRLVWFRFYMHETEKTEPNSNRKKQSQNQVKPKNQAKPV